MTKFYHGVTDEFIGSQIIPINQMERLNPELYVKYSAKYEGRESVVERQIPLLDCGWGDVVQLLPLHPRQLFELQMSLGLITEIPDYRYFEIDSGDLDMDHTVVFFKTAPGEENTEYKWLREVNLDEIQSTPEATKRYYESLVGASEPVFNYQFVPHVLYKGSIDISGVDIIRLR